MRANVNSLAASFLRRAPEAAARPWALSAGRRLHSDVASVAPAVVKVEPEAAEARPPLTDLHGRKHDYLRISLTERCNLRCEYCMPAAGVPLSARSSLLSRGELSAVSRAFAALGVRKVRLTGGEPTLRADLADIIQELSGLPGVRCVALTTNGLTLTRRLPAYQRAGLSALNVSLDSLRPERYERMARRPGLSRVLAGVDLALQLGFRPLKINTVLMKGFNDDEICDFVEFTRDREVEVRFIEFMPFSGNAWDDGKLVPHRAAVRRLAERFPDARPMTPRPNDTARVWQVPGFAGSVGFISSMTNNFCSTCNRMRLTADGNLKVCLFGSAEVSLRDAVRAGASDRDLEALIRAALNNKKPQHAGYGQATSNWPGVSKQSLIFTRHAESRAHGEPPHDTHRGLTPSKHLGTFTVTRPPARQRPTGGLHSSTPAYNHLRPEYLKSTFFNPTTLSTVTLIPKFTTTSIRCYSTEADEENSVLTHLDAEGRARMVDVGLKPVTSRVAEAECSLNVGPRLIRLLRDARLPKGDALTVAQVAGVIGAKKTSELIPLCHNLPLDCVRVKIELPKGECNNGGDILVHCEVRVTSRTGAEMEAMTGAAVAALTLYDMCKSVDRGMKVMNLRVVRKSGGRSGEWPKPPPPEIKVRPYDKSPIKPKETFVPTNIMHI